jgi:AsmA protein
MRLIRLLLLSLVVLVAAFGLLAAGVYGLARLSWSERQVAGWLTGELGLPVRFDALAVGYFPRPWLELDGLSIAASGRSEAGPIVEADRLRLVVPWRTVFGRRLAVDSLDLSTLRVHLVRDTGGVANWDELSGRIAELMAGESIAWSLGAIELDNASVDYRDAVAKRVAEASGVGVTGRDIEPGRFFPMTVRAALQADGYIFHAAFEGQAMVDPDRDAYAAQRLEFSGWLGGGQLPLAGVKLAATANEVNADLVSGTAAVRGLQFDGLGIHGSLQLEAVALGGSPVVDFDLATASFAPRTIGYSLNQPLPATADPDALGKASVALKGAWRESSLQVDDLHGTLDDSQFTGSLSWPTGGSPPKIRLDVDRVDLDRYLAPVSPGSGTSASPQAAVEALLSGLKQVTMDAEITVGLAEASGVKAHQLKVTLMPDGATSPERKP